MKCSIVIPQLSSYISGEVDAQVADSIRDHLDHCPSCADEMRRLSQTASQLTCLRSVNMPADVETRVRERLAGLRAQDESSRGWLARIGLQRLAAAGAVAATAAACMAYLLVDRVAPETPQKTAVSDGVAHKPVNAGSIGTGKSAIPPAPPDREGTAVVLDRVPRRSLARAGSSSLRGRVYRAERSEDVFIPEVGPPQALAVPEPVEEMTVCDIAPAEAGAERIVRPSLESTQPRSAASNAPAQPEAGRARNGKVTENA